MPTIVFNGKTYNNLQEMSTEDRQAYQQIANMLVDKNGNGIPDFLEGDIVKNISSMYTAASGINFNGSTYNNINELPPDVQAKVKNAFVKMGDMGLVPQETVEEHASKHHIHNDEYAQSTPFVSREYNPVIQEDKGPGILIWLLIGIGLLVCVGFGLAAIFLSI
ncbi:MAG: hypothetical protein HC797_05740 [Anaerolineales bacterium]|nr:hypothetical protein [Anaerolineales bacterium]